jgi:hypothetical protein
MAARRSLLGSSGATLAGLVIGATGISILWAAGQPFPFYPPPGIIILLTGAIFVGLTPWRWAPAVGTGLGLFVIAGFLLSGVAGGDGFDNLAGEYGAGRAAGQAIQLAGVIIASLAGVLAAKANHTRHTEDPHRQDPHSRRP